MQLRKNALAELAGAGTGEVRIPLRDSEQSDGIIRSAAATLKIITRFPLPETCVCRLFGDRAPNLKWKYSLAFSPSVA